MKGMNKYFPNWKSKFGALDRLNHIIYQHADRVLKKDCMDLPPFIRMRADVSMGLEQEKHYASMKRDFITFLDSEACVAELALTKGLRLQQLLCGIFKTDLGEIKRIPHNRCKVLKDYLEDLTPKHKIIVWTVFVDTYDEIGKVCEELGVKHAFLTGKQTTKQKQESIESFNNDPEVRVIIANQAAGGTGINLTSSSYSLYYSRSFNLESDIQSEARNYRGGSEQHEKVTRIDLVTPGTIDEAMLDALANKEKMSEAILKIRNQL